MSPPTAAAPFRQGAGRLCLDFIRTLRYRGTDQVTEELTGPDALAAWIHQLGPYDGDPPAVTGTQVLDARRLREAIYALLAAARGTAGPKATGPAALRRINGAASLPVPAPSLDTAGRLHWHAADPVGAMFALLARDTLDLATSPVIARVRECAGPVCGALFLDGSRPGTRRWCSMDRCGNLAKKSALRARHATS